MTDVLGRPSISHDEEAGVTYFNFHDPPRIATHSYREGNAVFRYDKTGCVGVTIIDYTKEAKT